MIIIDYASEETINVAVVVWINSLLETFCKGIVHKMGPMFGRAGISFMYVRTWRSEKERVILLQSS